MAYEFHYTPTGTGVISGKEVLEQTEDAINDLGNTAISGVQEALDKAEQALTNSENAVDDAQTALNTANNAEGVAIQAQTDVSNLSGTVTNIGNRVTTAEGNIGNLQGRMTTAEGNITNLQGRMTTAEGNIGNLQTAVSTAQATANSAQQTATTARQQSYVFRYSSTALVASSTNSNALLDNTDNLKVGDKVIDSSGVLFSITAIDTQNSTFTIGTALIDLAQDSDVVHKSGNETVGGVKTFSDNLLIGNNNTNISISNRLISANGSASTTGNHSYSFMQLKAIVNYFDSSSPIDVTVGLEINEDAFADGRRGAFCPNSNNITNLGKAGKRWANVYATNYYYGGSEVEFSTKFVTTDTAQTITGKKLFDDINTISSSAELGVSGGNRSYKILDKNQKIVAKIEGGTFSSGMAYSYWLVNNGTDAFNGVSMYQSSANLVQLRPHSSTLNVQLGALNRYFTDCYTSKVNGVEPSSLSLPSDRSTRIDISSYFTNTGTGDTNTYTVPANGFIYLAVTDVVTLHIFAQTSGGLTNYGDTRGRVSAGQVYAFLPVRKGDIFVSQWYTTSTNVSLSSAYFIPCQGNV